MYKKILIATDGSKYSEAAVKETIKIAKSSGGAVTIISVVDVTEEFETEAPGLTEKLEGQALKLVEDVKRRVEVEGVKAECIVKEGEPSKSIINTAKEKNADLIVVGSHGRTALARLLMGSVTERVIGLSDCSVLVV